MITTFGNKNFVWLLSLLTLILISGIFPPAYGASSMQNAPVDSQARALLPESIKKRGYFIVATNANYPPFEFYIPVNGNPEMVGYDVDTAKALGQTLGIRVKMVNVPFSSIITGLAAHKYDFSISAMSMTKEREKIVDFVGPYYIQHSSVAVQTGNPHNVTKDPLSLCGLTVGVQSGTTQSLTMLPHISKVCEHANKKPLVIRNFKDQNEVSLALASGRVDAQAAMALPLRYMAEHSHGSFVIVPGNRYLPANTGIALPKDSPLEPAIKAALHAIQQNGILNSISRKWGAPENTWLHPVEVK